MRNPELEELRKVTRDFLTESEPRQEWRAFYDRVRHASPVDLGRGQWLIAGNADVIAAMKDEGALLTALFPVTRSPTLNELFLGLLPFQNGVEHRRLRALTQPLLRPASVAAVQGHVSALVEDLLYPTMFERHGCDVSATLSMRVPHLVSCLLLDVSPPDWERVGDWSRAMYAQIGRYHQPDAEIRASDAAYDEFAEYVLRRTRETGGARYAGIGHALIEAWRSGDLDDKQLLSYFALFLLTGLDTLTYGIANAAWFLGNQPAVFDELKANPELAAEAFGEAMRLWGPVRLCVRQLECAVHLETQVIPAGSTVFLLIHAANRDPRRLERPDVLQWNRRRTDDLAFGVGFHGCLGTAVGKMVGTVLYRTLAERCGTLRASPGESDAQFIASLPILGIRAVRLFGDPARPANVAAS